MKNSTAGRQKNISVIYVKHKLFQQRKWSRTIDFSTTHIILFKSPRDVQQIGLIGRQHKNTQVFKEGYELATKQPPGHLLIDLDSKTSEVLRYCSNFVPPGLSNETERTMYAAANASVKWYQQKKW